MSGQLSVPQFDYSRIGDDELAGQLECRVQNIWRCARDATPHLLEMYEEVYEAHCELAGAGRDGLFAPWVESTGIIDRSEAYRIVRFIRARREKRATLHTLEPIDIGRCDKTALDLLCHEDTPAHVIKSAVKAAKQGKPVTRKAVKSAIADATAATEDAGGAESSEQNGTVAESPDEQSGSPSGTADAESNGDRQALGSCAQVDSRAGESSSCAGSSPVSATSGGMGIPGSDDVSPSQANGPAPGEPVTSEPTGSDEEDVVDWTCPVCEETYETDDPVSPDAAAIKCLLAADNRLVVLKSLFDSLDGAGRQEVLDLWGFWMENE